MVSLLVKVAFRLINRFAVRNLYVRRALWVLTFVRWFMRKRQKRSQILNLPKGEDVTIIVHPKDVTLP